MKSAQGPLHCLCGSLLPRTYEHSYQVSDCGTSILEWPFTEALWIVVVMSRNRIAKNEKEGLHVVLKEVFMVVIDDFSVVVYTPR